MATTLTSARGALPHGISDTSPQDRRPHGAVLPGLTVITAFIQAFFRV